MKAQNLDRLGAATSADHPIPVVGPFELALEAFVVLDDEQHRKFNRVRHARFRIGSATGSAAGNRMVKVVPLPGWLSTPSRPPIAAMSARASNAPMPKPPGLLDEKGWN